MSSSPGSFQRPHESSRGRVIERNSRWGPTTKVNGKITGVLTPEQLNAYALHMAITDLSDRLRTNHIVLNGRSRSKSPPPEYNSFGKRINTKEHRRREEMEKELTALVDLALRTIPHFRAPSNFKRYQKTQEKVFMPVHEYPNINFVGLLLGPRGKTLQRMEEESGAKIAIRGRGSVKEGRGRNTNSMETEEDLHCIVNAESDESLRKGLQLVHNIVNTAISMPEHHNELKRGQLRELAVLNGTLRDDEHQICPNCGQTGHRKFACPQQTSFLSTVVCHKCGKYGHFARDCIASPPSDATAEFETLIEELRESSQLPHKAPFGSRNSTSSDAPPTRDPSIIASQSRGISSSTPLPPGIGPPGAASVVGITRAPPPPPPPLPPMSTPIVPPLASPPSSNTPEIPGSSGVQSVQRTSGPPPPPPGLEMPPPPPRPPA